MPYSTHDPTTRTYDERATMLRILSTSVLALLFFLLPPTHTSAQEDPSPADEVLQVHGYWSVSVVREGRVVQHREFRNHLTSDGEQHLVTILAGTRTPGPWVIIAGADGTGPLCADNDMVIGEDNDCAISESAGETTVTVTTDDTLLMVGSDTVVRDGEVRTVVTAQWRCGPAVAPVDCQPTGSGDLFSQFTLKPFTIPGTSTIPVQAGDRLDITVEISFGTLAS